MVKMIISKNIILSSLFWKEDVHQKNRNGAKKSNIKILLSVQDSKILKLLPTIPFLSKISANLMWEVALIKFESPGQWLLISKMAWVTENCSLGNPLLTSWLIWWNKTTEWTSTFFAPYRQQPLPLLDSIDIRPPGTPG